MYYLISFNSDFTGTAIASACY